MAYQMPNYGKLGQAVLLSARLGVTDVFKAPKGTAYDHPTAWTYLGRIAPGSYKNDFTRKYFDVVTGVPETVKESFVSEVEGKVEFDLIEPTTVGYLLAAGNEKRVPAYGTSVNVVNDKRNSIEDIYLASTYGLTDGDEVEVEHTATRFYDGFDRDTSGFWESLGDVAGTWSFDTANSRLTANAGSAAESQYLLKDASTKDVDVSVELTQAVNAGILFRYQDLNNHYMLDIRDSTQTATDNIRLYKRVSGAYSQIAATTFTVTITRGSSNTVRLVASGTTITAYVNGAQVFSISDASYTSAGKVGFRAYGTTSSYFTSFSAKVPGNVAAKDYTFITDLYGQKNLVSYPENLEHSSWTKAGMTLTNNATIAPNGTMTADMLLASAGAGTHAVNKIVHAASGVASNSVYLKAGVGSPLFGWVSFGSGSRCAWFDLSAGTVANSIGVTASIQSVGDGWYKCTITWVAGISGGLQYIQVGVSNVNNSTSYTAAGTETMYIWGMHAEASLNPVDYETPMIRVFPRLTANPEESSTVKEIQVNSIAAGGSVVERFALRAVTTMTDGAQVVTWLSDCRVSSGIKDEYPDKQNIKLPISLDAFGFYDATSAMTLVGKKYLLLPDVAIDYAADIWSTSDDWLSGIFTRTELGSVKPIVPAAGTFTRASSAVKRDFSGTAGVDTARYEDVLKSVVVTHQNDFDFGATKERVYSSPDGSIADEVLDDFNVDTSWAYTQAGGATWTWNTGSGRLEGTNGTDATCVYNSYTAKNVSVEIEFSQSGGAGIVARFTDANNYYLCYLRDDTSSGTNNVQLYKRVAGVTTSLVSPINVTFVRGTNYRVRFEVVESQLSVYVDDVLIHTLSDAAITASGKVGLYNTNATSFNVNSLKIKPLQPLFQRNSVAKNRALADILAGLPRYESILKTPSVDSYNDFSAGTQERAFAGPDGRASSGSIFDDFTEDTSWAYTQSGGASWTWDTGASRITTGTAGTNATLIYNNYLAKNMSVEAQVSQSGEGGIIFRYTDENNYYLCCLRDDTSSADNIQLYKKVAGTYTSLTVVGVTYARGTTYKIRVEALDSRISVYWNDALVATVSDSSLTASGKVGFYHQVSAVGEVYHSLHVRRLQPLFARNSVAYHPYSGAQVAAGIPRYTRGKNLLSKNQSDVETDMTGFGGNAAGTSFARDTSEFYQGTASCRATCSGSDPSQGIYCSSEFMPGAIPAGSTLTASAYVKGTNNVVIACRVYYTDGTNSVLGTNTVLGGAWQRLSVSITATAGKTVQRTQILVYMSGTQAGTFYVDALQVEVGASATAWAVGGDNAIFIEETTTNLFTAGYDNPDSWTDNAGAVNTFTASQSDPYGGTLAYRVQTSGGTDVNKLYWNYGASAADQRYSFSVWVKNNSATAVTVATNLGATTVTVTQADGWKLVKIEGMTGDGATQIQPQFRAPTAEDNLDFYMMWPQLENKAYCTSYITPGTTRASERLDLPEFPSTTYGDQTLILNAYYSGDKTLASPTRNYELFMAYSSGVVNGLRIVHAISVTRLLARAYGSAGSAFDASLNSPSIATGWHRIGLRISGSSITLWVDGVKQGTTGTITQALNGAPNSVIGIGHNAGGGQWNDAIGEFAYFPVALSDADMLTAMAA